MSPCTSATPRELQKRIIGGRDATAGDFPYYVHGINLELCGGSLIAPDIVLTAAHCVKAFEGTFVTVGSNDVNGFDRNAEFLSIDSLYPHPDYTPGPEDNDIMMVKLSESAKRAEVVRLNQRRGVPSTDQDVVVIGFGVTNTGTGAISETLQEVTVQAMTSRDCSEFLPGIKDFHICAGVVEGGKDSCAGDSGSPLLDADDTGLQYGVVTFGYGCAEPRSPGVYSDVAYYRDWIREYVCQESQNPPDDFECSGVQEEEEEETGFPTLNPTESPTALPTTLPTNSPTTTPTEDPTLSPTNQPTVSPTKQPTTSPTMLPSLVPSRILTAAPSMKSSDRPSDTPSEQPSDTPSAIPSPSPTAAATAAPTESETPIPTGSIAGETRNDANLDETITTTTSGAWRPGLAASIAILLLLQVL